MKGKRKSDIMYFAGLFLASRGHCRRGIPVPSPSLIIPIIMARYENVINNTEDIVVAISHMVVGLCSVTILPLASTYVCQERGAMTSSSSAHLALPTERHTLGDWIFLLAPCLTAFFMQHPVQSGDKMSTSAWDDSSNSGALGEEEGRRKRGT